MHAKLTRLPKLEVPTAYSQQAARSQEHMLSIWPLGGVKEQLRYPLLFRASTPGQVNAPQRDTAAGADRAEACEDSRCALRQDPAGRHGNWLTISGRLGWDCMVRFVLSGIHRGACGTRRHTSNSTRSGSTTHHTAFHACFVFAGLRARFQELCEQSDW